MPLNLDVRHYMEPSQAFGVVIRSLGVIAWIVAAFYAVSTIIALTRPTYREGVGPWWHYLIGFVEFLVFGLVLLRKADWLVRLGYRTHDSDRSDV